MDSFSGNTPGWYADPWQVAALRWWDGTQWTGAVSEPTASPVVARSSVGHGLAALFGDADRIAVIDVETTGLYTKDRVVEIAIVTLDRDGFTVPAGRPLTRSNNHVRAISEYATDSA